MRVLRFFMIFIMMTHITLFAVEIESIADPIEIVNGKTMQFGLDDSENWYEFTLTFNSNILIAGTYNDNYYDIYDENLKRVGSGYLDSASVALDAGKYLINITARNEGGIFMIYSKDLANPVDQDPPYGSVLNPIILENGESTTFGINTIDNFYYFETSDDGNILISGTYNDNYYDIYDENLKRVGSGYLDSASVALDAGKYLINITARNEGGTFSVYSNSFVPPAPAPTPTPTPTLLKTGQMTIYAEYDDGYYQTGKTRSYSRSGDVIVDNATGLEWQDNETGQKTWDAAATYCTDLPLNGGGWRLPSIEELETLVDDGRYNPSTTGGVFQHISSDYYWSSTTSYASYSGYVWYVDFDRGRSSSTDKTKSYYVRCVRGEPMESTHTFSRNDTTEIVIDETTGLQWQDDTIVASTERTWTEAIDYCENTLKLGSHDDWRLPNKKELLSIVDRSRYDPAIDDTIFANISSDYYWSSTTYASYSGYVWYVDFDDGYSGYTYKTNSYYVRCVRGGQDEYQPPAPPTIPTDATASDGTLEHIVAVSWSEVANANYYNVYRSESQNEVGDIVGVTTSNSFSDDTIEENTKYYYRITACNDAGCSDYSLEDSGYTGNISPAINPGIIMYLLN